MILQLEDKREADTQHGLCSDQYEEMRAYRKKTTSVPRIRTARPVRNRAVCGSDGLGDYGDLTRCARHTRRNLYAGATGNLQANHVEN